MNLRKLLAVAAGCTALAAATFPVAACGSQQAPSPAAVPPATFVVRLAAAFSPRSVRLGAGQQFVVIVSKTVKVSGSGISGDCTSGGTGPAGDGLLSVRCSGGDYLYTAEHAGSTVLSATVRPRCKPGTMCPQWISRASLKITVT